MNCYKRLCLRGALRAFVLALTFSALFFAAAPRRAFAQEASILDDASLWKQKEYTSLEEALKEPANVYRLDLSHNGLTEFPMEILRLINLQTLNLSNNGIEILPADIVKLHKLQYLNLSTNGIKKLPAEIASLRHLKKLDLSQNQFLNSELLRVKRMLPQVAISD
jgi:hypothetical protein